MFLTLLAHRLDMCSMCTATYPFCRIFLQFASFQVANVVELAIDNLIILCPSSHDQLLTLAAACWILSFYEVLLHFNKFSLFVFFSFDPWRFFCLSCFCHCIMLMLAANATACADQRLRGTVYDVINCQRIL